MGMNKKILVVDDDLESLKLIGLMLQRRGYEILAARDGPQALLMAETHAPDLVILDVLMPDMDGYEVCQRLRSNPRTSSLPVVMFTAKTWRRTRSPVFARVRMIISPSPFTRRNWCRTWRLCFDAPKRCVPRPGLRLVRASSA